MTQLQADSTIIPSQLLQLKTFFTDQTVSLARKLETRPNLAQIEDPAIISDVDRLCSVLKSLASDFARIEH